MTGTESLSLRYGAAESLTIRLDRDRIELLQPAPEPLTEFGDQVAAALDRPIDFPPLEQMVVPGDRVAIALAADTPGASQIIAATWNVLERRDVRPEDIVVIQPPAARNGRDPRLELPEAIRDRVKWVVHDPGDAERCRYLSATAGGERVYLAREITESDVVLPVGPIAFDAVLGYRGPFSVLYPGLSSHEAITRSQGQGHSELEPDNERPLRQLIDEIGWLLGIQFCIQVVPAAGVGAGDVLAGCPEGVFRDGREQLADRWLVTLTQRPETVVISVSSDAGGHGWDQVGRALKTARNLVAHDGRIVLLTDLDEDPGEGLQLVRSSQAPGEALQPLRRTAPDDLAAATHLAAAADWAHVFLLSRLDGDLVEDLFLTPLAGPRDVERLLGGNGRCAVIEDAQHSWGRVVD